MLFRSWRGAINALDKVRTPKECNLTQSFRFGPEIADLANVLLQRMGETNTIRGNERVPSDIGTATHPDAIIARSNGVVLQAVMACGNVLPSLAGTYTPGAFSNGAATYTLTARRATNPVTGEVMTVFSRLMRSSSRRADDCWFCARARSSAAMAD